MKKTIIFNWKMNPVSLKETKKLFEQTRIYAAKTQINAEVIVAAPFVYLSELLKIKNFKLKIAAQNIFWAAKGAFTGEVSPRMLKNLGVEYVIIGHSERRQFLGETDEMINKKVLAALEAGLKVILCIGEPLSVRRKGKKAVEKYLAAQLKNNLAGFYKLKALSSKLFVAYEPIWAIGTGVSATPETALETIGFIKKLLVTSYRLRVNVLYGGSVNGKNILDFIQHKEIGGALVGGASLKKEEVKKILQ